MRRERWIEKLETIVSRVEAGQAPARIREIHVFGSFARGALEPNDLDLIVIHDKPSEEILAPLMLAVKSYSYGELDQSCKAYDRFQAAMRRVFRRGGERMDIKLAESLDSAANQLPDVPGGEIRLVWSESAWASRAGSPWELPPRAPTDPDVPVKEASGSSRCGFAVPHTTRSFRGDTLVRLGVLGVVPTPCPQRGAPFAPRGPEGPFPRFKATMRHCDSLPPISPRFVAFAWRYHRCVPFVRPRQPRTRTADQPGVGKPVSPPGCYDGDDWVSQVPGEPF